MGGVSVSVCKRSDVNCGMDGKCGMAVMCGMDVVRGITHELYYVKTL
jgi:hypothetical protein